MKQFDFGSNWDAYSRKVLDAEAVAQARNDFKALVGTDNLSGVTFLDIGFGQGLSLLTAAELGAIVVGNDINPTCKRVVEANSNLLFHINPKTIPIVIGSILDPQVVEELANHLPPDENGYDLVHSWGVLHHTGSMWKAISNAASLVKPGGRFIIAIYQRHWSSRFWLWIKWLYNRMPRAIKWFMIQVFYIIIAIAKWLVTRQNPFRLRRGMHFYFDVVDWLGGYPYEYASQKAIIEYIEELGFSVVSVIPAHVPTGCNEFIFNKHTV